MQGILKLMADAFVGLDRPLLQDGRMRILNSVIAKGAFRNNVIKKVGRSGLEMITNCYMVDGWVLWMITLFYKIADF